MTQAGSLSPRSFFSLRSLAAFAAAAALWASATPNAEAQSVKDPENTIRLEIGLGYDSPADQTPRETGEVLIELTPTYAPKHAERIKELVREGYYDGKLFHRVIDDFMAQTGSPRGDGIGGSEKPDLKAEFSNVKFERGVVGMARTQDPDSANAQFFIMFTRYPSLDAQYTVIGHVVDGMDVVDKIQRTEKRRRPLNVAPDRILSARVMADS